MNPYRNITFNPDALPESRFAITANRGDRVNRIGTFPTLAEAMAARDAADALTPAQ